jgi:hypothetical protein
MIALHCRSWAGPVRSSLGKRVPQTRLPNGPLTMLHQRSSRINHQEVVLHRALARLDKIHSASSISRAASTFSSFGIPKPTVRGSLASLVDRPLWG